jgi:protein-disulfide isomerase
MKPPRLASHAWLVLLACLIAVLAGGCGGSASPAAPSASTYIIPAADLAEMLTEKMMGNASAPITLIDYSSLTCPHCATFHLTTLPQLKRSYIDTGQVKYIYRDFPVAGASTPAMAAAAAALARCAGNARYFEALDLLYSGQAAWVGNSNPTAAMKQALAPIGMPAEKMDACLGSSALQDGINRQKSEGQAVHGVTGTPTLFVNGQRVSDNSFTGLAAVLQPLVPSSATCRTCHSID